MRALATCRVILGTLSLLTITRAARAEQLVLFDITYTHTGDRNAHHEVKAPVLMQPDNWTAPINYAGGTIHFYQEVETKPSPRVTIIDFCFISNPGYGCIETLPYTKTGVNETTRQMAPNGDWYQRNQIDFTKKMGSIELVIKDPATYTNGCPMQDCVPSKMRFVATLVSPGGTYQKPAPGPGFGGGGGADAAAAEPDAAATTPDAAMTVDAAVAEPEPDAAATTPPPAKPDAAATTPKPPTTKADAAASSPPSIDDPTDNPPPRTTSKKSSSCAIGGGAPEGLARLLGLVLIAGLRRRRRG